MKNLGKTAAALLLAGLTPWTASAGYGGGEAATISHPDSRPGVVRVAQLADSESLAEYYRVVLDGIPVASRPDVSSTSQSRAQAERAEQQRRLKANPIFSGTNR